MAPHGIKTPPGAIFPSKIGCFKNIYFFIRSKTSENYVVEAWYSLEQYIGLKEDKLSSTTVDFIRSEGNLGN